MAKAVLVWFLLVAIVGVATGQDEPKQVSETKIESISVLIYCFESNIPFMLLGSSELPKFRY
jgi:hypothetical protein